MMKKARNFRNVITICFVLAALLFVSCDDHVSFSEGAVEIGPSIQKVEDLEGLRVLSSTNAAYFIYKLTPSWTATVGVIHGSTTGLVPLKGDGTPFAANGQFSVDYQIIDASDATFGYVSQGKWHLTAYALDDDYNFLSNDPVVNDDFYLNSTNKNIVINVDELISSSSATDCSLRINNVNFELVGDYDTLYGQAVKDGYRVISILTSKSDNSSIQTELQFDSFIRNTSNDKVTASVSNFLLASNIKRGAYTLQLLIQEHDGSEFKEAGGSTFSFNIVGPNNTIDGGGGTFILKASDFVAAGTGSNGVTLYPGNNTPTTITLATKNGAAVTPSTTFDVGDVLVFNVTSGASTSFLWTAKGIPIATGGTSTSLTYTIPSGTKGSTIVITYTDLLAENDKNNICGRCDVRVSD